MYLDEDKLTGRRVEQARAQKWRYSTLKGNFKSEKLSLTKVSFEPSLSGEFWRRQELMDMMLSFLKSLDLPTLQGFND
jgi:hypothetical protein